MTCLTGEWIFSCKKCDFFTNNKRDYTRHIKTLKHVNYCEFSCDKCVFVTSNKKDYERHLKSNKHKSKMNDFICTICNKTYKHKSGLCKHIKVCHDNKHDNKNICITDNKIDKLEKMVISAISDNKRTIDKILPNIGNTYNTTNKMTINVFLNEQCKEAINMNTFVNNLNLSIDDLKYTTDHGYVKGISNIFAKYLQNMPATERPIHCSDKKRMQFYIKDDDTWKKDKAHTRLDKTISQVSHKQIKQIKEWEKQYPEWNKSDKETEMYLRMIQQVMGGQNDEEIQKNKNDIKKELGNTMDLKMAIENT